MDAHGEGFSVGFADLAHPMEPWQPGEKVEVALELVGGGGHNDGVLMWGGGCGQHMEELTWVSTANAEGHVGNMGKPSHDQAGGPKRLCCVHP